MNTKTLLIMIALILCSPLLSWPIEVSKNGNEIVYIYSEEENEAVNAALDTLDICEEQRGELYNIVDEKTTIIQQLDDEKRQLERQNTELKAQRQTLVIIAIVLSIIGGIGFAL